MGQTQSAENDEERKKRIEELLRRKKQLLLIRKKGSSASEIEALERALDEISSGNLTMQNLDAILSTTDHTFGESKPSEEEQERLRKEEEKKRIEEEEEKKRLEEEQQKEEEERKKKEEEEIIKRQEEERKKEEEEKRRQEEEEERKRLEEEEKARIEAEKILIELERSRIEEEKKRIEEEKKIIEEERLKIEEEKRRLEEEERKKQEEEKLKQLNTTELSAVEKQLGLEFDVDRQLQKVPRKGCMKSSISSDETNNDNSSPKKSKKGVIILEDKNVVIEIPSELKKKARPIPSKEKLRRKKEKQETEETDESAAAEQQRKQAEQSRIVLDTFPVFFPPPKPDKPKFLRVNPPFKKTLTQIRAEFKELNERTANNLNSIPVLLERYELMSHVFNMPLLALKEISKAVLLETSLFGKAKLFCERGKLLQYCITSEFVKIEHDHSLYYSHFHDRSGGSGSNSSSNENSPRTSPPDTSPTMSPGSSPTSFSSWLSSDNTRQKFMRKTAEDVNRLKQSKVDYSQAIKLFENMRRKKNTVSPSDWDNFEEKKIFCECLFQRSTLYLNHAQKMMNEMFFTKSVNNNNNGSSSSVENNDNNNSNSVQTIIANGQKEAQNSSNSYNSRPLQSSNNQNKIPTSNSSEILNSTTTTSTSIRPSATFTPATATVPTAPTPSNQNSTMSDSLLFSEKEQHVRLLLNSALQDLNKFNAAFKKEDLNESPTHSNSNKTASPIIESPEEDDIDFSNPSKSPFEAKSLYDKLIRDFKSEHRSGTYIFDEEGNEILASSVRDENETKQARLQVKGLMQRVEVFKGFCLLYTQTQKKSFDLFLYLAQHDCNTIIQLEPKIPYSYLIRGKLYHFLLSDIKSACDDYDIGLLQSNSQLENCYEEETDYEQYVNLLVIHLQMLFFRSLIFEEWEDDYNACCDIDEFLMNVKQHLLLIPNLSERCNFVSYTQTQYINHRALYELILKRGTFHEKSGEYSQSEQVYTFGIEVFPEDSLFYLKRAEVRKNFLGDLGGSCADLEQYCKKSVS